MPPRAASGRRTTRFSSREPEQPSTHDSQNTLIRPQLPPLQGTPSSRRQYTYGSGVEPPPRVGTGLQRMDVSNAINQALSRRDETGVFVRPPKPQATATAENETSRENGTRLSTTNLPRQVVAGSDADSLRSFGMESDYYEDATIGSAPTSTPGPQTRQHTSKPATRTQQDAPQERASQPQPRLNNQTRGEPPSKAAPQGLRLAQDSEEEDDEEEEEDLRTTFGGANHGEKANTPAPNRLRQTRTAQLPARSASQEPTQDEGDVDEEATDSEQDMETRAQRAYPSRRPREESEEPFEDLLKEKMNTIRRRKGPKRQDRGGLFSQANEINRKMTSFDKAHEIPDDPWERDFAIQQEIREVEDQVARERAEREERARLLDRGETWQQWFTQQVAWFFSLWPFSLLRRQPNDFDDDFDEDGVDHTGPVEWWRLLHPMTYLNSVVWLADRLLNHIFNFIDRVSGTQLQGTQAGETLRWLILSLLALLAGGAILTLGTSSVSTPGFPNLGSPSGFHWPNPVGFLDGIGNMVPSISWGTDKENDIWNTPTDNSGFLEKYKKMFTSLEKKETLHDAAIKKMESLLPKIIVMDLDNGRPVIATDFYHALRDLLKQDDSLNLDNNAGLLHATSDEQWKALMKKLSNDPAFASLLKNSTKEAAQEVESKLPGFWERWVKNNDHKVQEALNKASDKGQAAGSGGQFDERVAKIVNEQLKKKNQAVISRGEFLKQVESEFTKHRKEINAEMAELKTKTDERIKTFIHAATSNTPKWMGKTEISNLVQQVVKNALAEMTLQAIAKGKIQLNWDASLKNQVNFFGLGAGAVIDTRRTTPAWDPWNKGVVSTEAYEKGLVGVNPLPPIAALYPWQDEGDCWCAARTVNHRGNAHSASIAVQLAHLVVPQQVVVEHILPGATTDPDARPRQIEVWARIEADERSKVRDFSNTHFPDNKDDWNFTPPDFEDSFVKISQFVYESSDLQNGVHVHQLSPELEELGAATDHVILRAVSNYGAKTHTCFYRVRLFGKRSE
ncbi:hypothetical protein ACHAPT_002773 [Fusarium lateritium]